MSKIVKNIVWMMFLLVILGSCSHSNLTKMTVILDWTPNTHHTGLYVAQQKQFYTKAGLDVHIIQPHTNSVEQMISMEKGDVGISSQGSFLKAREKGMPLMTVGAIGQHNLSGLYSLASKNINSPKDLINKVYGGWGSASERAMIKSIIKTESSEKPVFNLINVGSMDIRQSLKKVDFVWGFSNWQGIKLTLEKTKFHFLSVRKILNLDEYIPIFIIHKKNLQDKSGLLKKFMKATLQGYHYAIDHPKESAEILLKEVPELEPALVLESQKFLSKEYQKESVCFGIQDPKRYKKYALWLYQQKVLDKNISEEDFVSNRFLDCQK